MNANDVLIDLMADTQRRLHRFFNDFPKDLLYWQPQPGANSIGITLWHMGRLMDVFLFKQIKGEPDEHQCWYRDGWSRRSGYDPRGLGRNGWGTLNDYTPEEVAAIPEMTQEFLLGYVDDVIQKTTTYVINYDIEELLLPAVGWDAKYTRYQVITMAMMDQSRHLGELYAIKAMWERTPSKLG